MKKKLLFKKDIYKINIPFWLTDLEPWQDQIKREMEKLQSKYSVRKSAKWGFEITEMGAQITVYKQI